MRRQPANDHCHHVTTTINYCNSLKMKTVATAGQLLARWRPLTASLAGRRSCAAVATYSLRAFALTSTRCGVRAGAGCSVNRNTIRMISRHSNNSGIPHATHGPPHLSQNVVLNARPIVPKGMRMGWGKEVLNECIPFTAELVGTKRRAFDHIAVSYVPAAGPKLLTEDEENIQLQPREYSDSWLQITLPFYDHSDLRDTFAAANGKTVRHGLLFEILDALAADIAYRHCGGGFGQQTIVTAAVDGVQASSNIDISNDLKIQGYISYVGRSSMEVD
jgi:hypothetical protein